MGEPAAGLAQLGAGRHDHHPRPRARGHLRAPDAREQSELARPDQRALVEQHVSLADVLALATDVLPRLGRLLIRTVAAPPSVHSTGTTASAPWGTGAPVMIFTAVPGDIAKSLVCPAADSPTTGRWTGSDRGVGEVGGHTA